MLSSLTGYAATAPSAQAAPAAGRSVPPGQLGGPFTAASLGAAEDVLARSGVATVANEGSKVPLVRVVGSVRELFTRAQVETMAVSAADGGGIAGSTLASVVKTAKGMAPFSYVLASWVLNAATPGSEAVRRLMGTQDWRRAPSITFPTIALPLFVSDVIANTPRAGGHAPAAASAPVAATTAVLQPMGFFDAPCSTISNFVQDTIDGVFNALRLTPASGVGAAAGIANFFVTLWNGAVVLAQQVVQGLINKVSQFVVSKIRLAAGTAIVIANIVSYLNPWSVKVVALPSSVVAGDIGEFRAQVAPGNGISAWPTALLDCLPAGVDLPPLDAANAKATWSVTAPVFARTPTSVSLDSAGHGVLGYGTTPAPRSGSGCSSESGPSPPPAVGSATLIVARPGIEQLKQLAVNMITNGFGVAGSIVSPALQAIVDPLLAPAVSALGDLISVRGTAYVVVTHQGGASSAHCTTTTAATTSTTAATKTLLCPDASVAKGVLGLTYPLSEFYYLLKDPTYVSCIYTPGTSTVECPDGDGSFVNGASGGCELVQVSELTGASGSLNTSSFCADHGPCESQGPLPSDALDGGAAYEAKGPETDRAAIYIVARKAGFEVDLGVGWEASTAGSEALIRYIFAQHFGTT